MEGATFFHSDFSLSLLKQTNVTESFVISPFSIALAVSLVRLGARENTLRQIDTLFNFNENFHPEYYTDNMKEMRKSFNEDTVSIEMANGLFLQEKFQVEPLFIRLAKERFDATPFSLGFLDLKKDSKFINDFVSNSTRGMIKQIVTEDELKETVAIIVNSISLDAKWTIPFTKDEIFQFGFTTSSGEEKPMEFMLRRDNYLFGENEETQILSLSYAEKDYKLVLLLPKNRTLAQLRESLTGEELKKLQNLQQLTYIHTTIPKFEIKKDFPLKVALQKLGVKDIFGAFANLSGLAGGPLYVTNMKHKATISVNESGTKAGAATVIQLGYGGGGGPKFVADRPFLFFVTFRDSIIFTGQFDG